MLILEIKSVLYKKADDFFLHFLVYKLVDLVNMTLQKIPLFYPIKFHFVLQETFSYSAAPLKGSNVAEVNIDP